MVGKELFHAGDVSFEIAFQGLQPGRVFAIGGEDGLDGGNGGLVQFGVPERAQILFPFFPVGDDAESRAGKAGEVESLRGAGEDEPTRAAASLTLQKGVWVRP